MSQAREKKTEYKTKEIKNVWEKDYSDIEIGTSSGCFYTKEEFKKRKKELLNKKLP